MGWVLMANLSRLLLLNERRKFGLLRLRGVSGRAMGQALQLAIGAGAVVGGLLGAVLGTVLPMLIYEGALLPIDTLLKVQQPWLLAIFIAIGLVISLLVSRRLVRYVARISPLEASGRVAASEADEADVRFGPFEAVALLLGSFKVVAWIAGFSLTTVWDHPWVATADRALDFVGFPLFVYGVVSLLASRRRWLRGALRLSVRVVGGPLRQPILEHLSTRPHRIAGFLLIVALMTTISLYPTIMAAVFNNKIARGAQVQLGSAMQVAINAADMVDNSLLASGGLAGQYQAIDGQMSQLLDSVRTLPGVAGATYMIEGVSEGVYVPGYGYNGLPIYLVPDPAAYLSIMYHEEQLTEEAGFTKTFTRLGQGEVLISPSVATYQNKAAGDLAPLGRATDGQMLTATVAGTVRYLPGSPLTSITDKDSFASARIDYVNHLFNNNAYIVANPTSPGLETLDVLVTGLHLAINTAPGADTAAIAAAITGLLPAEPLAIRTFASEMSKVGTDMYVYLARENVQVYLIGGLLLALIGILSIAYANYMEDRRILALLRIRGVGPGRMLQFFGSGLFAPSLLGVVLGVLVSLVVGYGMTNLVWQLRSVQNILIHLNTHLAISPTTLAVGGLIVALLLVTGLAFSRWVFRHTARHSLAEA
jgi:hypothetical protein